MWVGAGGGRSLILNGHTDVVSPEPLGAWTMDPFAARVVPGQGNRSRGRMYGRGTQDMKSGVIANLFAVRALKESGIRLQGNLILQSVIEEEAGGGGGTLACFQRGYLADGFIATEPHWRDVAIAHPGILYIIAMLGEWDRERAARLHYEPFERLDPAARRSCHLNVGVVRAGDWPSTVPGRAEIEVRMSFVPGETEDGIKRQIAERIGAVAQHSPWLRDHPPRIEYFGWHSEPWLQDERHPFVQSFMQCMADLRRAPSRHATRAYADEALPILAGSTAGLDTRLAGAYGVPALAWGPQGGGLHGADEYVELDAVIEVARTLAVFATRWCGVAS